MRRFALMAITLIMILAVSHMTFAQENLKNNPRYIECPIGMGIISYIDTYSVKVVEYKPPQYIITINKIEKGMKSYLRYRTFKFRYDYDKRKMYLYSPNSGGGFKDRYVREMKYQKKPIDNTIDWNSDWQYVVPGVYYGEGTGDIVVAGEIAFAIAYNLKFHGDKYLLFQDGFYAKLPNATKIKDML